MYEYLIEKYIQKTKKAGNQEIILLLSCLFEQNGKQGNRYAFSATVLFYVRTSIFLWN